jgi:hypothetical protein
MAPDDGDFATDVRSQTTYRTARMLTRNDVRARSFRDRLEMSVPAVISENLDGRMQAAVAPQSRPAAMPPNRVV